MKRNIFCSLVLSAMLLAAYELNAAPAKQEKKNLRPQVAVIQKDGKKQLRRCFRDADKNGFCDRGTDQKGKCKNNCRKVDSEEKKSNAVPETPKPQLQNNNSKSNSMSVKPEIFAGVIHQVVWTLQTSAITSGTVGV